MRVVFMGTPDFAVPALEQLIFDKYDVAAVYTQPDKPAGRGREPSVSPVKRSALALGLAVEQPVNFKPLETRTRLAGLRPDVIVVAAFGQILPQEVLDIPRYKCVNIHPSLLPRYRGPSPIPASILAGDEFAGISIMLMDAGLDTGPVLTQGKIAISSNDTTGSLTEKLALVSARMLVEALPLWAGGKLEPRPQGEAATIYTAMLIKDEGEIDWRLPAEQIWLRVRAFQPWPGCYTYWNGKEIKIIEALPVTGADENQTNGEVIPGRIPDIPFGVVTGNGVLGILKIQLEGKRAMPAADFLRGQPRLIGSVLSSKR